jgi:hypothetical protein
VQRGDNPFAVNGRLHGGSPAIRVLIADEAHAGFAATDQAATQARPAFRGDQDNNERLYPLR